MTLQRLSRVCSLFAVACVVLAFALQVQRPVMAQDQAVRVVHLQKRQMNAADLATVRMHRAEIIEAAEIYGYNLVTGDWSYRQTLCLPMPHTILLHYSQRFQDGTESLFTALVPRGEGTVRIVPVLHRNATLFVPAPRNPRNFALFNTMVPSNIASQFLASSGNWIELSACYAEMTGANIEIPRDGSINAGVAGAPTATIQLDSQHKTSLVIIADRESWKTVRVWSISFNHAGRVTAAGTEVYPVIVPPSVSQSTAIADEAPEAAPVPTASSQMTEAATPSSVASEQRTTIMPAKLGGPASIGVPAPLQKTIAKAIVQTSQSETSEPGWKFIPEAPQPPSKFIPQAPAPPTKVMPESPNQ